MTASFPLVQITVDFNNLCSDKEVLQEVTEKFLKEMKSLQKIQSIPVYDPNLIEGTMGNLTIPGLIRFLLQPVEGTDVVNVIKLALSWLNSTFNEEELSKGEVVITITETENKKETEIKISNKLFEQLVSQPDNIFSQWIRNNLRDSGDLNG